MTFRLITYLNFACPQAKKKKELFVLKQKGHFCVLFCRRMQLNRNTRIAWFNVHFTSKFMPRLISTFFSLQN